MSWCLVNEVTMDLTGVVSLSVSDDVRDYLWPIISSIRDKPNMDVLEVGAIEKFLL